MPVENWDWTTADEKAFASDLAERKPAVFMKYARIVLNQWRWWDIGVNVYEVQAHVDRLRKRLLAEGKAQ